uniref:Uncharacterized protein n=1 Tax=Myotis myotis TaxID=51298 RepID=A0A7J7RV61_MYOMY|nr:hypothetical protein mMyoMyo1_010146 [Myotis myotis]
MVEHRPANQEVTARFPGQGTCPGCEFDPQCGACRRQPIPDSLSSWMLLSLPPSPFRSEIHKNILKEKLKRGSLGRSPSAPSALDARPRCWEGDLLLKLAGGRHPAREGEERRRRRRGRRGRRRKKKKKKVWRDPSAPGREGLSSWDQLSVWMAPGGRATLEQTSPRSQRVCGRQGWPGAGRAVVQTPAGWLALLPQEKHKGGPTGRMREEVWGPGYCQALGPARPPAAPEPNISMLGSLAGCPPPLAVTSSDL